MRRISARRIALTNVLSEIFFRNRCFAVERKLEIKISRAKSAAYILSAEFGDLIIQKCPFQKYFCERNRRKRS